MNAKPLTLEFPTLSESTADSLDVLDIMDSPKSAYLVEKKMNSPMSMTFLKKEKFIYIIYFRG